VNGYKLVSIVWLMLVGLCGCSSLLPSGRNDTSTFRDFDEARQAIEALVPMTSTVGTLRGLGIDPLLQPNTVILTQADIVRRFVPSALLQRSDLDAGVMSCLEAKDECRGWELSAARINKARTGSFLADFTNFSRRSETTGWRFNALILLVHDVVVYRSWGGQPNINEVEVSKNPLGPLQDMGPVLLTTH
jgi:hypothetical protein